MLIASLTLTSEALFMHMWWSTLTDPNRRYLFLLFLFHLSLILPFWFSHFESHSDTPLHLTSLGLRVPLNRRPAPDNRKAGTNATEAV